MPHQANIRTFMQNTRRYSAALLALALVVGRPGPAAADPTPHPPLRIPFYSQRDARWAKLAIGAQHDVPMRTMGSLLSAMAMVAESYALIPKFEDYTDSDPRYLNAYLSTHDGYKVGPPKTVIVDYYGLNAAFLTPDGRPAGLGFENVAWGGGPRNAVDARLDAGRASILYIDRGENRYHPVVVVGWDEATRSYLIVDPAWEDWYAEGTSLRFLYGEHWEQSIAGALLPYVWVVRQQHLPMDDVDLAPLLDDDCSDCLLKPVLDVSTKSPVEIVAIDPRGRRIGFDAATGTTLLEIPTASYARNPVWADATGEVAPLPPGRQLTIRNAVDGRYRFEMIATGTGPYTLNVRARNAGGDLVVRESRTGTVTTGDVLKFQVEYSRTNASHFTIGDNFPPEARAGGLRRSAVHTPVAFDAGASFDVDGSITAYHWDFGDGATATGVQATHGYAARGEYTATLTVTDDHGATRTDTAQIAVYDKDLPDATTERASVASDGAAAAGDRGSSFPAMSADGRFVAFTTAATNLAGGGLVLHDRRTGTTEQIPASTCTSEGFADLSADGRFVAFQCSISDPATGVAVWTIVVHDRTAGTQERVDVSSTGIGGTCPGISGCGSRRPAISADGRFVAFYSDHTNLVAGDTNDAADVFVHDRQTGTTERVSVATGGTQAAFGAGGASVDRVGLSADGRFVAFDSLATDLVAGTAFAAPRVYVRDRQQQRTELVSVPTQGTMSDLTGGWEPSISADGRVVAFLSNASDLVPGDTNGVFDVFVRDRAAGTTERMSLTRAGGQAICGSLDAGPTDCVRSPVVSADGRTVVFRSQAPNLVLDDTNHREDVFVRDRVAGETELVSRSTAGEPGNGHSGQAHFTNDATQMAVSADGRFVAFSSAATNLVEADDNSIEDMFVRDRRPPGIFADPAGPYLGWVDTVERPASITFDASRSLDPTGHALTARWDFGDGSPVATANATAPVAHRYSTAGQYVVTLVVDNGTRNSQPTTTVAVVRPSHAPTLRLRPACGAPGDHVTVDVEGAPLVALTGGWNLAHGLLPDVRAVHPAAAARMVVTGPTGSGPAEQIVPITSFASTTALELSTRFDVAIGATWAPGTYTVTAPDEGGVAADFVVPCPALANEAPHASVGGPYQGIVGAPVSFDGSGSHDPEGAPLTYQWWFEDGGSATGSQPAHVFTTPGTYAVVLIVGDGAFDSPTSVGTGSYTYVTILATPPVRTITDLTAHAADSGIALSWTCPANAVSYNVYRGFGAGGPYSLVTSGHMSTSCAYDDAGLTPGTTYYYRVTSVDADGQESLYSNETAATVTSAPGPCATEPVGATFRSLGCRLANLGTRTQESITAGSLQGRLERRLDKAQQDLARAQAACMANRKRLPKNCLKRVVRRVTQTARTLESRASRRLVDDATRTPLVAAADEIRADARTLQQVIQCPADAEGGAP